MELEKDELLRIIGKPEKHIPTLIFSGFFAVQYVLGLPIFIFFLLFDIILGELDSGTLIGFAVFNFLGIFLGRKAMITVLQTETWEVSNEGLKIFHTFIFRYRTISFRKNQIQKIEAVEVPAQTYKLLRPRYGIILHTTAGEFQFGKGWGSEFSRKVAAACSEKLNLQL